MADTKQIRVVIAGKPYPVRVSEQEEASLRAIVQQINEEFNNLQIRYQGHDKQDCLAMMVLTYATDLQGARQLADTSEGGEMSQRLEKLNALVDGML